MRHFLTFLVFDACQVFVTVVIDSQDSVFIALLQTC